MWNDTDLYIVKLSDYLICNSCFLGLQGLIIFSGVAVISLFCVLGYITTHHYFSCVVDLLSINKFGILVQCKEEPA
jgi:hypothetical protein